MKEPSNEQETLGLIEDLHRRGIERMAVLMRHGARHYDSTNPENEPFQVLTEEGKADAHRFGLRLPKGPNFAFRSSIWGRCIETAYQVEKGCIEGGANTEVNVTSPNLAPFYIRDFTAFVIQYLEQGREALLRTWFDGRMDEQILAPAREAVRTTLEPVLDGFLKGDGPQIAIAVTHDWNLYLVREFCLGQRSEDVGAVHYLEGVAFFEQDGALMAMNHLGDAMPVTCLD